MLSDILAEALTDIEKNYLDDYDATPQLHEFREKRIQPVMDAMHALLAEMDCPNPKHAAELISEERTFTMKPILPPKEPWDYSKGIEYF